MKGYKAFEPGLICRGKQYAENTVFEEPTAEICRSGMHFCKAPLDVLDYYSLINKNGELNEFAEVESLDAAKTDDGQKYTTKKLKIGTKVSIKRLGELHTEYVREVAKVNGGANCGNYAKQIGGNGANQIGGNFAKQFGGDFANQIGGNFTKQFGDDDAKQIGGDYAKQFGGNYAKQIGGNYAKQIGGNGANQIGGNFTKQFGDDDAKQIGGKNSVMVAGEGSCFKAGLRSVILHYWRDNDGNIGGFKAAQIDGVTLMPDTWYKLENGEFVEAD